MINYEKELKDLLEKVSDLENRLKEIQREDDVQIGVIKLVGGKLQLDLYLNKELFDDNKMKRLENIANEMQQLLLDIEKELNE